MIRLALIALSLLCGGVISNSTDFKFYWNVPTSMCHEHGMNFDEVARNYGIIQNTGDFFYGDRVRILYDPGMFPALTKTAEGKIGRRNGGVPQEGDLSKHLEQFERALNKETRSNFSGIGIIDMESWRPIFRQHWGALADIKRQSINIERELDPHRNNQTIERVVTEKFERSARTFMEETLKLAKRLRPDAQWSYYAFPYCFNVSPGASLVTDCSALVQSENDKIDWLWKLEDIIMPSVYLDSRLSHNDKLNRFIGRVKEAKRLATKYNSNAKILIYFWSKYQNAQEEYLSNDVVTDSFNAMIENGADGVIIWGSSYDFNSSKKCEDFQNYLHNTLGPAVTAARKYAQHRVQPDQIDLSTKLILCGRK